MESTVTSLESLLKNFSMIRAMQAKLSSKYLMEYQFSPNELDILILLSNNPTIDTAKELAIYLNVSKTLICRSLDHLIEEGFLLMQIDEEDHRLQRLRLHTKAQPVIKQIKKARSVVGEILLQGIQKQDLDIVNKVFQQMKDNIDKFEEEII